MQKLQRIASYILTAINLVECLAHISQILCGSLQYYRSSHPEVFLGKDTLKICSKFTGEHP